MTSPHMPPRRGREPKTPRQTNTEGPTTDERTTQAHPDRPTSNEPSEHVWALESKAAERRRLRNLAESHAHEAHRLAGTQAGNTHAQIALVYATLAGQEKRP